jgi:hypothetical protein
MIFDAQRSIPVRQETYRIHILVCPHAQPMGVRSPPMASRTRRRARRGRSGDRHVALMAGCDRTAANEDALLVPGVQKSACSNEGR